MLKKQGLPITGVKQDLVARLGKGGAGVSSDKKEMKATSAKSMAVPPKSMAAQQEMKSMPAKSMAIPTKSIVVGMMVGMCGGGGKVVQVSNHSVLKKTNRKKTK